jgi:lysophospholipase L1-like esterase
MKRMLLVVASFGLFWSESAIGQCSKYDITGSVDGENLGTLDAPSALPVHWKLSLRAAVVTTNEKGEVVAVDTKDEDPSGFSVPASVQALCLRSNQRIDHVDVAFSYTVPSGYTVPPSYCQTRGPVGTCEPGSNTEVKLIHEACVSPATIVAFGDSITFGYDNGDKSWADFLGDRLGSRGETVYKEAGTGRKVTDAAQGRFSACALAHADLQYVIVLEGINDIYGGNQTPEAVINAYRKLTQLAHSNGTKIIGGTLLPTNNPAGASFFGNTDPVKEAARQAVNRWILIDEFNEADHFDGVINFDAAVRANAADLNDVGGITEVWIDGLSSDSVHPQDEGQQRLASAAATFFTRDPRVYYHEGAGDDVAELAWMGSDSMWHFQAPRQLATDRNVLALASDSAPVSIGVGLDLDPRVYYVDSLRDIEELAWWSSDRAWHARPISIEATHIVPAVGQKTALTAFGVGDTLDPRVYYVDGNQIFELLYISASDTWQFNNLDGTATPGTAIAGVGVGDARDPRVYYFTADNHIHEFAWFKDFPVDPTNPNGKWHERDVSTADDLQAPAAQPGSVLAVMGVGPTLDPRVYYFTADNHVHELAWFKDFPVDPSNPNGKWHERDVSTANHLQAPAAQPGSALAAMGVGPTLDPRVYYFTADNHVHELAWFKDFPADPDNPNGKWHERDVSTANGLQASAAQPGKALAAMGVGPALDPRVYYLTPDNHVHELAWFKDFPADPNNPNGKWHERDVSTADKLQAPGAKPGIGIAVTGVGLAQ